VAYSDALVLQEISIASPCSKRSLQSWTLKLLSRLENPLLKQLWIRKVGLCDIYKFCQHICIIFRDRDFCAYIVTHNVLAEVWELPPKEVEDRYDERLDWLEDVDIAAWLDDDELTEEVLEERPKEEPEELIEDDFEERPDDFELEERFEEENPERTEVNSDDSDDTAFDGAEETVDVWDTDISDEAEDIIVADVDDGIGVYVTTTAGEAVFVIVTVTGR
jgi:hypothetical protein